MNLYENTDKKKSKFTPTVLILRNFTFRTIPYNL